MEEVNKQDDPLWKKAQERVDFKRHFRSYLMVNVFLWIVWALTSELQFRSWTSIWPIWCTIGWGIGVFSHYLSAYQFNDSVEKEYEKLKRK